MNNPKAPARAGSGAEVRSALVDAHGAYDTVIDQRPKVWHTDPDCSTGQQIEVQSLRGGHGDKERHCTLC